MNNVLFCRDYSYFQIEALTTVLTREDRSGWTVRFVVLTTPDIKYLNFLRKRDILKANNILIFPFIV